MLVLLVVQCNRTCPLSKNVYKLWGFRVVPYRTQYMLTFGHLKVYAPFLTVKTTPRQMPLLMVFSYLPTPYGSASMVVWTRMLLLPYIVRKLVVLTGTVRSR